MNEEDIKAMADEKNFVCCSGCVVPDRPEEPYNDIKILCPYCNAPYSSRMEATFYLTSEGCSSCGNGATADIDIEIYCESCKRLVYKKEIRK